MGFHQLIEVEWVLYTARFNIKTSTFCPLTT